MSIRKIKSKIQSLKTERESLHDWDTKSYLSRNFKLESEIQRMEEKLERETNLFPLRFSVLAFVAWLLIILGLELVNRF